MGNEKDRRVLETIAPAPLELGGETQNYITYSEGGGGEKHNAASLFFVDSRRLDFWEGIFFYWIDDVRG